MVTPVRPGNRVEQTTLSLIWTSLLTRQTRHITLGAGLPTIFKIGYSIAVNKSQSSRPGSRIIHDAPRVFGAMPLNNPKNMAKTEMDAVLCCDQSSHCNACWSNLQDLTVTSDAPIAFICKKKDFIIKQPRTAWILHYWNRWFGELWPRPLVPSPLSGRGGNPL